MDVFGGCFGFFLVVCFINVESCSRNSCLISAFCFVLNMTNVVGSFPKASLAGRPS